ncbi:MAG TPA: hypothetical protein VIV57_13740 [Anaeromyxobacter sp.]
MATTEPILETQLVASPPHEVQLGYRFTVGGIIGKTFTVWWKHVLAFTVLSAVVYSPITVSFGLFYGSLLSPRPPAPDEIVKYAIGFLVVMGLTILLAVIQAGAVTYGTVRHLSDERPRLGDMLRAGFRRGLPVVGVGVALWVGTVVGLLVLVVPGVMFMVASSVAIPAAVVEKPGILGAFRRSFTLTRGRRWPLFAAWLAVVVIVWVLAAVIQVGATLLSVLLPPQARAVGAIMGSQLGNVFFSALPLIGIAVAYHELRAEKEGVDTAALAKVFE